MAKDSDRLASAFETEEPGGLLSGLLAEEDQFDRRMMWRLGSWGAAAVGAVTVAVMANQAQIGWHRDQTAAADLARQSRQLQVLTRESQNETRRLASSIETLNSDRDRLYARVTVLEQGLDSVTGAIARQNGARSTPVQPPAANLQAGNSDAPAAAAASPRPEAAPPAVAPVVSTQSTPGEKARLEIASTAAASIEPVKEPSREQPGKPLQPANASPPATTGELPSLASLASKAPPDSAVSKPAQPETPDKPKAEATGLAAAPAREPEATETEVPAITVQQTRFAIDLGSASSVPGLRALWRGLTRSKPELANLRPIIMIREGGSGTGMQLRLGAGPLVNAAAAAKICASMIESDHSCETTVFDGQRLSMHGQETGSEAEPPSAKPENKPEKEGKAERPQRRRSYSARRAKHEEPPPPPPPQPAAPPAKPETTSALSSFFSRRQAEPK